MNVFIGWSKQPSEDIAKELRKLLEQLFDRDLDLFMSSVDMPSGADWREILKNKLGDGDFAVFCVTKGNRENPWILYEAGHLNGTGKCGSICPYLFDLGVSDVPGVLQNLQARAANQHDTLHLVLDINRGLEEKRRHKEDILRRNFRFHWKPMERKLKSIRGKEADAPTPEEFV